MKSKIGKPIIKVDCLMTVLHGNRVTHFPPSELAYHYEKRQLKKRPVQCIISVSLRRCISMPAKNPRINVVLEKPLYTNVERLAERDGVSLSLKVRDLVKEALEIEEDIGLAHLAEIREKTFNRKKSLRHDEVWKI
jgi:hypothetical protein